MSNDEPTRRKYLKLLAGTTALPSIAGCSRSRDDENGQNTQTGDNPITVPGEDNGGQNNQTRDKFPDSGMNESEGDPGENKSVDGNESGKKDKDSNEENDPIFDENLIEKIHEESLDRRESAMKLLPAHDDWGGVLFGDYKTLHSLLTETYGNIEYDAEQFGADSEWFLNVITDTDGTSLTSDYLNAKFIGMRNPEGNPLIDKDKYEVSRQVRIEGESLDLFRRDDWPNWTRECLYLNDENLLAFVENNENIDEYRSDMAKILNGDVTTVWDEDYGNSFYNSELTDLDSLIIAAANGEDIRYIGESNLTDVTDRHDNQYSNIHVYSAELQEGTRPKILEEVIDPTNQYKPVIGPNERELRKMASPPFKLDP